MPSVTFATDHAPTNLPLADITFHWYMTINHSQDNKTTQEVRVPESGTINIKGNSTWTPEWGEALAGGNDITVHVSASLPTNYSFEDGDRFTLAINNPYLRVITPFKKARANVQGRKMTLYLAYNKLTSRWSSFKLENSGWLRAFGPWISMAQTQKGFKQNKKFSKELKQHTEQKKLYQHPLPRFSQWDINKPGIIELVHPASGRHISFATGHYDSETLLVVDEKVIYRVNNQIYQAEIIKQEGGEDKLINHRLLVQDDMVPGIHWAFMSE